MFKGEELGGDGGRIKDKDVSTEQDLGSSCLTSTLHWAKIVQNIAYTSHPTSSPN